MRIQKAFKISSLALLLLTALRTARILAQAEPRYCIWLGRSPGYVGEGGGGEALPTYIDPFTGVLRHPDPSVSTVQAPQPPKVYLYQPSPDGKYGLTNFEDGRLVLDENATGKRTVVEEHIGPLFDLQWLDTGIRYAYMGGDKPAFMVLANVNGTEKRRVDLPAGESFYGFRAAAWSDDHRYVAYVASGQTKVVVRSGGDGSVVLQQQGQFTDGRLLWSPTGDKLLTRQYADSPPKDYQAPRSIFYQILYVDHRPPQPIYLKSPLQSTQTPMQIQNLYVLSWSPNGRYIELVGRDAQNSQINQIYDTQSDAVFEAGGSWTSDSTAVVTLTGPQQDRQLSSYSLVTRQNTILLSHIVGGTSVYQTQREVLVWRQDAGYMIAYMDNNAEHRNILATNVDTLPSLHYALNYAVILVQWHSANHTHFTWFSADGAHIQTVDAGEVAIPVMFEAYGWHILTFVAQRSTGATLQTFDVTTGTIRRISPEYAAIGAPGVAKYLNYVYFPWKTTDGKTGVDVYDVDAGTKLTGFAGINLFSDTEIVVLSEDQKTFVLVGGPATDRHIALADAHGAWSKILRPHYHDLNEGYDYDQSPLVWSPDARLFFYSYLRGNFPFIDVMTANGIYIRTIPIKGYVGEAWAPCR